MLGTRIRFGQYYSVEAYILVMVSVGRAPLPCMAGPQESQGLGPDWQTHVRRNGRAARAQSQSAEENHQTADERMRFVSASPLIPDGGRSLRAHVALRGSTVSVHDPTAARSSPVVSSQSLVNVILMVIHNHDNENDNDNHTNNNNNSHVLERGRRGSRFSEGPDPRPSPEASSTASNSKPTCATPRMDRWTY